MSAERIVMISSGCWASAVIRQQMEPRGWKLSVCEGALYEQVEARGERCILLAPVASNAQQILAQTSNRALPINGPDQVVSLISSLFSTHHQRQSTPAAPCSSLPPYPTMLKWMSCRLEGLPDRLVEALLHEYATLDQLLPAALGQPTQPRPSTASGDLEEALQEISTFFRHNHHLW